jgi:hypothetical protein
MGEFSLGFVVMVVDSVLLTGFFPPSETFIKHSGEYLWMLVLIKQAWREKIANKTRALESGGARLSGRLFDREARVPQRMSCADEQGGESYE